MNKFLRWWHQEGSGINPSNFEDVESFTRQICATAWSNGEYVAFTERERLYDENVNLKETIVRLEDKILELTQ